MERANSEAKHAAVRGGNSLFGATLVGGVFVVCLIRLMGFVKANAGDLISADQWDFLTPLFDGKGPGAGFFYQHGPHRQVSAG